MNQKYRKFYNFIKKSDGKLSPEQLQKVTFEREFLSNLLKKFIRVLGSISAKGKSLVEPNCGLAISYYSVCVYLGY